MPPKARKTATFTKLDDHAIGNEKSVSASPGRLKTDQKDPIEESLKTEVDVSEIFLAKAIELIVSNQDITTFDRVIGNADLVGYTSVYDEIRVKQLFYQAMKSLLQDDKHILANQVNKLIEYCRNMKADLDDKQRELVELMPKIQEANDRMEQAVEATLSAEHTINGLQIALENAWREIDAAHLREQALQEQMSEKLEKVSKSDSPTRKCQRTEIVTEVDDAGPLAGKGETILRERDRLQAEVEELDKRLQMQRLYSENVEKYRMDAENANQALMHELESSDTNKMKFRRRIQDLYMNLDRAKEENGTLNRKIGNLENRIEDLQKQLAVKINEAQVMRSQYDKIKLEQSSWNKLLLKRNAALDACNREYNTLKEKIRDSERKLKAKEFELAEVKKDSKKSVGNYDQLAYRLMQMENTRMALAKDITILKNQMSQMKKECSGTLRAVELERHEKEIVLHERDALRVTIARQNNIRKDLEHTIVLKNKSLEHLQEDLAKKSQKYDDMKQSADIAIRERDKFAQETEMLNNKIAYLEETVTLKTGQITNLKRDVTQKHALYIKIQKNLETVNSERLVLRQQLQSCTEDGDQMRTQMSNVTYQVSQLKEEISNNQKNILSCSLEIEKLSKEKFDLKMEIRNKTELLNSIRNDLKDTKKENERLYKLLSVDERRLMKQARKLDSTVHEKDLIGSQMIRRNNEITLLKEQISILQVGLQRGQVQYNQRIEDIKLLKQEILRLRSQKNVLTRGLANTADMRQEVLQLHRLLMREKVANAALQEEAITPINIHRWRSLAARDPERMELILKIIFLQKRILRMHSKAVSREKELQMSHKLYATLKGHIEKLPSYKVKEDLVASQRILRMRSRKLKALAAELNTKENDIKARDCAIENLQTTLNITKKVMSHRKKQEFSTKKDPMADYRAIDSMCSQEVQCKV